MQHIKGRFPSLSEAKYLALLKADLGVLFLALPLFFFFAFAIMQM
jgi:hypothetical protein